MSNYSDQILLSLLKLGNKMDSIMIIKRFGSGIIDQQGFVLMMRVLDDQIPQKEVQNFYLSTLIQYEASALSAYILNDLLRQASQIQAKQNVKLRSPNDIFHQISKALQVKNQDIERNFKVFDFDKDNLLNEKEFKNFLVFYVPTLTPDEYNNLKNTFPTQKVSLYNLMSWMQESNSMRNSIKAFQQPKKDPLNLQIDKKRRITPNTRDRVKETTPTKKPQVPQKPQQNQNNIGQPRAETPQKDKQEKSKLQLQLQQQQQQQQQEQNQQVKQKQQQQQQQQQQQLKIPNNVSPQKKINPILESILYEDPQQANILKSDIQFQNHMILDYNIPGVQEFLKKFNDLFKQKQIFTDTEFPANVYSLGSKLTQFQWKRLNDIWPNYEVFVKDVTQSRYGLGKWISPKDICQGQLGDCYFLSVLSSMACRWPDFLLDLFLTQTRNPCGIYSVRLCIDGVWKAIILDDYVPIQGNQPAFSSSPSKEIWVLLMEKAWAKSFGSYSNIISGDSKEVIRSLTGGPTWSLKTDQPDFKEQFIGNVQRKCLMTTGTFSKLDNTEIMGLIADHAYSILKIRTIQHPSKGDVTLIKLRNPWGKKEWIGEWSDDSPSWTKEIKQQLRISEKAEDGIFYMSYQDFIRYFKTIYVGYFQKNYIYTSQTILSKSKKSTYFIFNIDTAGQYYFTAQQQSSRHFKDKYTNYEYSSIRMILASQTKQGYEWEYAKQEQDQQVYVGELLDKGHYILQVKVKWLFWNEEKFVISAYGPKEVKLKQIQKDQIFIKQVLQNHAKQNPKREQSGCPNLEIISELSLQYGIGYEYYKNTGKDVIQVRGTFTKMVGLKLKKPERGNQYQITLQPDSEYLVAYTIQAAGFQTQQSRSYTTTKR